MRTDDLDFQSIDVQLNLIMANRLLFETKEEFAEYAGFGAIQSNNPIARKKHGWKVDFLDRLTKEYLSPTGFQDFGFFFEMYDRASGFFRRQFEGKAVLKDGQCALKMAYSLFFSHQLTGESKLDGILEELYDYEIEYPRKPRVDFEILLLMVLGVLPPMSVRGPRTGRGPDFEKEWGTVSEFIKECIHFNDMFENNPTLSGLLEKGADPSFGKSRFFFLQAVTTVLDNVDRATRPTGIDKVLFYYDLDGLWQNWVGRSIPEKNVYYQFIYGGQGYNFIEYEVHPSVVRRTMYYGQFFYDGDVRVFHLLHPRGSYLSLMGIPLGDNDYASYSFEPVDSEAPGELDLHPYVGGAGFDLKLGTLRKVDEADAKRLWEKIESPRVVIQDRFEEYRCIYPLSEGIYAITKTDLFIIDPDNEGEYYRVPKEIDERLETLSVDNKAGVLKVGKEEQVWLGFEPIALYLSPERMKELGIEKTDHIS